MNDFYNVLQDKLAFLVKEKYISQLENQLSRFNIEESKIFNDKNIKPRKRKPLLEPIREKIKIIKSKIDWVKLLPSMHVIDCDPFNVLDICWEKFNFCFPELLDIDCNLSVLEKLRKLSELLSLKHNFNIWNQFFEYNFKRSEIFYYHSKETGCMFPGPSIYEINQSWPDKRHLSLINNSII